MLLCCSAGTSAAAESARRRQRSRWIPGLGTCLVVYFPVHSVCHHMYRAYFNVIDLINKARHGEVDMAHKTVHPTRDYVKRLTSTVVHFCAVNAIMIYIQINPDETRTCIQQGTVSKTVAEHYRKELALQLIGNTVDHVAAATRSTSADAAGGRAGGARAPSNFMPVQPHEHDCGDENAGQQETQLQHVPRSGEVQRHQVHGSGRTHADTLLLQDLLRRDAQRS